MTGQQHPLTPDGVIGITDDGYPIVTSEYACSFWQAGSKGLSSIRECWYCKYADFRKSSQMTLEKSICRNSHCRIVSDVGISPFVKNEGAEWGG